MVIKAYDESTAGDFRQLFEARFPGGNAEALEMLRTNPFRRMGKPMGSVAYDDAGRPIAIQGVAARRAYCGQSELTVGLAMVMAVAKDVDRSFFTPFLKETMEKSGADLIFGNTAIPGSRKRLQAAVGVADGPASCAEIRERQLRSNGLLVRVVRKIGAKMEIRSARDSRAQCPLECAREVTSTTGHMTISLENAIADADFNIFWQSYLKANTGLVSSRTAEELRWVFGKGLASGEVVLITARKDGALQGYAFCRRTDETATCWRVVDLIALVNDEKILETLVIGASQFLRTCTPALYLQITGYPTWVQPLLKRLFPKSSSFGFNKCIWVPQSEKAKALCNDWVNAPNGWYGCPYDGDMCLM